MGPESRLNMFQLGFLEVGLHPHGFGADQADESESIVGEFARRGHTVGDNAIHGGNYAGAGELVAGPVQLGLGHPQVCLFLQRHVHAAPQLGPQAGELLLVDGNATAGLGELLPRFVHHGLGYGQRAHFFMALQLAPVVIRIPTGLFQGGLGLRVICAPGE